MKKNMIGLALVAALGAAPILIGTTGCASKPQQRSTGQYIDDQSIIVRVKKALTTNPEYKFSGVTVTSYQGDVQLGGTVDSPDQKKRAGELAMVNGVQKVENNIQIRQ